MLERTRSRMITTLQPDNVTASANDSATGDNGWTDRVTHGINTTPDVDMTAVNVTTVLDEMSTSTEDWLALTTDVNVSRHEDNASTESVWSNKSDHWLFPLPSWVFDNDSFAEQSIGLLEEMIKAHKELIEKHKHEMVTSPGKQIAYPIRQY